LNFENAVANWVCVCVGRNVSDVDSIVQQEIRNLSTLYSLCRNLKEELLIVIHFKLWTSWMMKELKAEDEAEEQGRKTRCGVGSSSARNGCEDGSGAILIFQHLPGEMMMFDRNNSVMEPGSLYPSMKEFRLAMRQYSIDKEFELGIEATDKRRYRGYCRGEDCPWSIVARVESKGWYPIIVTVLHDEHTCTSSGRQRTSVPISNWVADKAFPILMVEPDLGAKKLQKRLQHKYNVVIGYDTVWKGKEKAMADLYGTWEQNFQQLFNWKAAMMEKSLDNVIELDMHMVCDKMYFNHFFCALGSCIQGF
jgi:hypothetical protein